jgi:hypothetical protein
MKEKGFIYKFCIFLEILSILCLLFFVWIVFSNWSNTNTAPDTELSAQTSTPGKGFAIFMFITCLNGNILLIPFCWFPHLSWRGKTLYEILFGKKDNRDDFERRFQQLFLTVGKTGSFLVFALISWQSMLIAQGKLAPYQGRLLLPIIVSEGLILLATLIYYIIKKSRAERR